MKDKGILIIYLSSSKALTISQPSGGSRTILLGLGLAVFFRQTSGLSLSPVDEIESA
jgi:hypothetical protein